MIIFAWKVNNPLSFLISPRLVKALNHFFSAIPVCLGVHTVYCATKQVFTKTYTGINVIHLFNKLSSYCISIYVEQSAVCRWLNVLYIVCCFDPVTAAHKPSVHVYETFATNRILSEPK